jgi:hypothetical protein
MDGHASPAAGIFSLVLYRHDSNPRSPTHRPVMLVTPHPIVGLTDQLMPPHFMSGFFVEYEPISTAVEPNRKNIRIKINY